MRIKYKAPGAFFYRRFWRVTNHRRDADGSWTVLNRAGKVLHLPAGMVVIVVP